MIEEPTTTGQRVTTDKREKEKRERISTDKNLPHAIMAVHHSKLPDFDSHVSSNSKIRLTLCGQDADSIRTVSLQYLQQVFSEAVIATPPSPPSNLPQYSLHGPFDSRET
jgi:hypothetical protein